jgi:hypothetical protein
MMPVQNLHFRHDGRLSIGLDKLEFAATVYSCPPDARAWNVVFRLLRGEELMAAGLTCAVPDGHAVSVAGGGKHTADAMAALRACANLEV